MAEVLTKKNVMNKARSFYTWLKMRGKQITPSEAMAEMKSLGFDKENAYRIFSTLEISSNSVVAENVRGNVAYNFTSLGKELATAKLVESFNRFDSWEVEFGGHSKNLRLYVNIYSDNHKELFRWVSDRVAGLTQCQDEAIKYVF
jgi:hypothetical protein